MKPIFALILLIITGLGLSTNFAVAATKKKVTTTRNVSSTETSQPEMAADFGFGTLASKFHFGVGFRMEIPTTYEGHHLRFGGRTGFYLGPSSPSTWIIPFLGTGTYEFPVSSGTIKPYAGLGIGFSLTHFSSTYIDSHTNVDFALMFNPGLSFEDKYYAELQFGTMSSEFALFPAIGMRF